uniref:Uncharacterized protein n=1 Tax=Mustela putorius furo TaxID=9669 RepID=M3Y5R1_MUSPF
MGGPRGGGSRLGCPGGGSRDLGGGDRKPMGGPSGSWACLGGPGEGRSDLGGGDRKPMGGPSGSWACLGGPGGGRRDLGGGDRTPLGGPSGRGSHLGGPVGGRRDLGGGDSVSLRGLRGGGGAEGRGRGPGGGATGQGGVSRGDRAHPMRPHPGPGRREAYQARQLLVKEAPGAYVRPPCVQGHCCRGRQPWWVASSSTVPGDRGHREWPGQVLEPRDRGSQGVGPGEPAWGAEAAVHTVVLAELGALGVRAGVGAGRAALLVPHAGGADLGCRGRQRSGPRKLPTHGANRPLHFQPLVCYTQAWGTPHLGRPGPAWPGQRLSSG